MLGQKVLVLNQNYEPLAITSLQRAVILMYLDKVHVVEKYEPLAVLSGHAHESPGAEFYNKTLVMNAGPAIDNHYGVVHIENHKIVDFKIVSGN